MYPDLCAACGEALVRQEQHICLACLNAFPKTGFQTWPDNEVERRFWGKVPVERGMAFFYYEKESALQRALYRLKYRGEKEIGAVLGRYVGTVVAKAGIYDAVDVIVPVPLHPKKLAKRGYNQSEWIARGLAEKLNKPMDTEHLVHRIENVSQTRKGVFDRYLNMQDVFAVDDPQAFADKHVLLVDDVVTTGSTLEACIQALLQSPGVKASVFALSMAH